MLLAVERRTRLCLAAAGHLCVCDRKGEGGERARVRPCLISELCCPAQRLVQARHMSLIIIMPLAGRQPSSDNNWWRRVPVFHVLTAVTPATKDLGFVTVDVAHAGDPSRLCVVAFADQGDARQVVNLCIATEMLQGGIPW